MIDAVRAYARAVTRANVEGRDVDLPSFPAEARPYLHMSVATLSPNEYWATSVYDFEMCRAVHEAWQKGERDARDDHDAKQAS